jgi:signal peptidase I
MENTLLIGDRMLVRVFPRPDPKRSDVVVFHYPLDHRQIFVKRVIGMPGDRINMKDRVVYLNGVALREPYVVRRFPADVNRDNLPPPDSGEVGMDPRLDAARTEMLQKHIVNGEVVVPVGNYFVLGDNRDDSLDSRYWGFVKKSELIGEPFLIYDSEATSDEDLQTGNVRSGRTRTRWSRVFKIL